MLLVATLFPALIYHGVSHALIRKIFSEVHIIFLLLLLLLGA